MAGKGGGGKGKDPSMLEDDYFTMGRCEPGSSFLPALKNKKAPPAMNYSGKIPVIYSKSKMPKGNGY